MCARSPVSILQEHFMKNYLQLPEYNFTRIDGLFQCIVTAGKINAVGTGASKQQAKTESAKQALILLSLDNSSEKQVIPRSSNTDNVIKIEVKYIDCTQTITFLTNVNYIGKLNEICAQNTYPYPNYAENGVKGSIFLIRCDLKSFTAVGEGLNKKEAKQQAAFSILQKLINANLLSKSVANRLLLELTTQIKPQITVEKENREAEIAKIIEGLTLSRQRQNLVSKTVTVNVDTNQNVMEKDEHDLKRDLAMMNLPYTIHILSRNPYVVVLQVESIFPCSVIFKADTYEEAIRGVLREAINDLMILKKM